MAHHVEFNRILDRLYKRRTDRLRRILNPKAGKVRTLTKRHREKALHRLEGIVSLGLAEKMAKRTFEKSVAERKSWRPKGWGAEKKLDEFRKMDSAENFKKAGKGIRILAEA